MRYSCKYIPSKLLALIMMSMPVYLYGQEHTQSLQSDETTLTSDSLTDKHTLCTGAGFGTNFIYLGSTISYSRPYYFTSLTYGFRNKLYVSASACHIDRIDPFAAFYSLSASYIHVVNSWFDISAEAAGYKTPESLQETLFNDFAFVNLTTGFDWKLLYTKLSFIALLSQENRGYIQVRNSHYFETPEFFKGKATVSFDPNINVLFGRMVNIETITGIKKTGNAPLFVQLKRNWTTTTETYSYFFGLMQAEFSIPVTFNYRKFSLEAEPLYILPAYSETEFPAPKGFSLNITAYIRIL
jgi:hypothetical protein